MYESLKKPEANKDNPKNEEEQEKVEEENPESSPSQEEEKEEKLYPYLSPGGQHFCVGPEAEATDVFVFTFQLVYARDLDKVRDYSMMNHECPQ